MPFNPYDMDSDEWPPLWAALLAGNLEEAKRLIGSGANLDDLIEEKGDTLLHRAAQSGDLATVNFFLKHGCPRTLESFDYISHTPLIRAAANGQTAIVDLLLWKGANPNAHEECRIGNTALREAVRGGYVEIVALLLEAGGDPTIPGWMQLTAVDQAAELQSAEGAKIRTMLAGYLASIPRQTQES